MTPYLEQAIRDVAAATLSGRGCRCRESLLHDYAVAQRERVLELEAELTQWRVCGWAQLQQKEGEQR